ncbi:hypothetical protein [Saccharopolyspora hordei]|uniref:Uncharacterized protein n=1 Tax=Saccharopolyspora hordei TaxID=1838 RepID=A0A853ADR1_9PSEU|nr:hypothetical protein [Saccharopolyspora hordei]NYI82068.1 hypothetical protein [Saccharopolyspora hordei]
MQTWAKRGVQAALVTGGMLAVGTGVATAEQSCSDRPTSPLGESLDLGTGACASGEFFSEHTQYGASVVDSREVHRVTALSGTLDPVRDLLPAVENDVTREMPALRDWHTPDVTSPLHLAGWVADPADARPLELAGLPPFDGNRPVTPAEGFHRSLSWAGPIGEVVRGGADALDEETFRTGAVLDVPADLLTPHDDLVYFDGFEPADGIVELWEGVLAQPQPSLQPQPQPEPQPRGGLLTPDQVDLTSAELPGFRYELHGVPSEVLEGALSAIAAQPAPRTDHVPLEVPGELQLKVTEVPNLTGLSPAELRRTTARRESPGVQAPLPVLGQLNAFDGGQTTVPAVSRITSALDGDASRAATVTDAPHRADVAVDLVDELGAAVPATQLVTQSPLRPAPAPRAGGLDLPVLGGGVPDITAVQGHTLPLPGLSHAPRGFEDADTVVFSRI